MIKIQVIDSHTGGEPTRIVVEGGPDLGTGPIANRQERFRNDFDSFRRAVVNEPRGSDVLVGGLLCKPHDATCDTGIIFFNNAGFLGMCGHGTIGLMATLQHLGMFKAGDCRIETSVGPVTATLLDDHHVSVNNVTSYRSQADISIEVDGVGSVTGDVAWGGNWFFLVKNVQETLLPSHARQLTDITLRIRDALANNNICGDDGQEIDHIELFGPPHDPSNHSRNFVLCPGGAYDRSPCGTGTSAKMACLAAEGKLQPGEIWRQESVVGSVFEGHFQWVESETLNNETTAQTRKLITPTICGSAHVCAESTLLLDPNDPFCMGINCAAQE